MTKLFVSGILVAAAVLATLGLTAAHAGGPTPTPTATPTPSPTATPVPTSTITIRFVRDGQPVTFTGNRHAIVADGVNCQFPEPAAPYPFPSEITVLWPMQDLPQPPECTKGPPTTIHLEYASEFGLLVAEFVWNGEDITIDVEVPLLATPTPTPSAQELPSTGGAPGGGLAFWAIAGFGIVALGAGAAIVRFGLRRRFSPRGPSRGSAGRPRAAPLSGARSGCGGP